jgi:hypothetical protein
MKLNEFSSKKNITFLAVVGMVKLAVVALVAMKARPADAAVPAHWSYDCSLIRAERVLARETISDDKRETEISATTGAERYAFRIRTAAPVPASGLHGRLDISFGESRLELDASGSSLRVDARGATLSCEKLRKS